MHVDRKHSGEMYLKHKVELLGNDGRFQKRELIPVNAKITHLLPIEVTALPKFTYEKSYGEYRRPRSNLSLYACEGCLLLIRMMKLTPGDKDVRVGIMHEETRIYDCESTSFRNNDLDKSKAKVVQFRDPSYAKCFNKIILADSGNYKMIDLIELRCKESSKEPCKKLIPKIGDYWNKKGIGLSEAKICCYNQLIGYGKGLLTIETVLELPAITKLKILESSERLYFYIFPDKPYTWYEARDYTTNNYESYSRSLLPSYQLLSPGTAKSLRITSTQQGNVKTAKQSGESPPNSGLSDTSAGGGSESGSDHSPHLSADYESSTARDIDFRENSPPTAVCKPSSANTAISPTAGILCDS
uniref:Uncharacterized protein n=1 Tax=Setaria digitata TaxID=48799 RepID=A0A915PD94_9BILA